jgi:hypothetical protein
MNNKFLYLKDKTLSLIKFLAEVKNEWSETKNNLEDRNWKLLKLLEYLNDIKIFK